jgi:structure-specific recognition protein 1
MISFKNKKTGKTEQVAGGDIENCYWLKRAKGHCFKLVTKEGDHYRFDGFHENDFEKLENFTKKHIKKPLEKFELSIKGWNWGKPTFRGDTMQFAADGKTSFELPLKNVSNTNVGKNEAIVQFHQNDDAAVSLMEIRFHVPNAEGAETDAAQELIDKINECTEIEKLSDADAICTLTELNCVTPRGRYDVKFFTDFIDLHGKTFDYKISYEHILRLFLLPHKDQRQMYFVMAMDPPIKQGNTRYPFLIVLFNIEEQITVDLTISDKTKEKFGDRLDKLDTTIEGPYHEVVSRICRTVLDKKITVPGNFTT